MRAVWLVAGIVGAYFLFRASESGGGPDAPTAGAGQRTWTPAARERAVAHAKQDLASRLGLPSGPGLQVHVRVESVEEVTWPDAGLGCGRVDYAADPGPVAGYRIVLSVDLPDSLLPFRVRYLYHASVAGHLVLCEEKP